MYSNEFRQLGINAPNQNNGTKKVACPKCEARKGHSKDKDLYLNYDSGVYKCFSPNCDFQGSASRLKKQYSRPKKRNNTLLSNKAIKYLEGRGISQNTIKKVGLSTDERGNIEFNYFRDETLINVKTRFEKNGKKGFKQHSGAEKIVYNLDSLEGKKKAIFVEGEMDVLSFVESGISNEYGIISVDQGAGQKGSSLDGKLECLKNCAIQISKIEEWYLCFDKDESGQYLQEEIIRRLGIEKCKVVDLPKGCKDANDVLKSNDGQTLEAKKGTLRLALKNAKPVPMSGVYTLDNDMMRVMEDYYNNGRKKGETTHFPSVDPHFTFLTGDITLITGVPGDGKSQWTRMMMVTKAKFDNWKWACYAPEDFPADYYYEDLCHIYMGKSTDKGSSNRASIEEYREAMLFVREHFFLVYPEIDKKTGEFPLPTNKWINNRIKFLKLKYGVNAYVKDPWNKIHHDFSGREDLYLAQELSKEKFFASQYDAALYIAHPHKVRKDKDGKIPEVGAYDISGGAMFFNMMDNILLVVRPNRWDNPSDKMVNVKSLKIKKQKLVGVLGTARLWYDKNKEWYYEESTDYNPIAEKISTVSHVSISELEEELPF